MTANIAYWFFAYCLTFVTVIIGLNGVHHIRAGAILLHRRRMVTACNLMLFFVATYGVKVLVLGREDKSDWTTFYLVVLYIHEAFIFLMLIFGSYARYLAFRFKGTLLRAEPPREDRALRRRHRGVGKLALTWAICALGTATVVLYGMVARAGWI